MAAVVEREVVVVSPLSHPWLPPCPREGGEGGFFPGLEWKPLGESQGGLGALQHPCLKVVGEEGVVGGHSNKGLLYPPPS